MKTTTPADIAAAIDHMKGTARNWDVETFATRTVGLLIYDRGNLNKYQQTLELVFRVHEAVITDRQSTAFQDHANDTVDALVQAEAFIRGFEDDELQEGIPDLLAGLHAAIVRERARPDLLAALKGFVSACGGNPPDWLHAEFAAAENAVAKAEGRANG